MADFLVLTPMVIAHSIVRVVFYKFKESNHILSIRDVITRPEELEVWTKGLMI